MKRRDPAGPDLGLNPGDCATPADVDDALMRLEARRIWAELTAADLGCPYLRLLDELLDRRLTLARP